MTIDKVMLGAVRHYLMGMVSTAGIIHSEMQKTGRSFDYVHKEGRTLGGDIDDTKQAFLRDCEEMLKDPVPAQYAHREDYHLNSADRSFLTELYRKATDSNWNILEEVERLRSDIDMYAPHGGFRSGI